MPSVFASYHQGHPSATSHGRRAYSACSCALLGRNIRQINGAGMRRKESSVSSRCTLSWLSSIRRQKTAGIAACLSQQSSSGQDAADCACQCPTHRGCLPNALRSCLHWRVCYIQSVAEQLQPAHTQGARERKHPKEGSRFHFTILSRMAVEAAVRCCSSIKISASCKQIQCSNFVCLVQPSLSFSCQRFARQEAGLKRDL